MNRARENFLRLVAGLPPIFWPMRREDDDGELEIERQEPIEHDEEWHVVGGEG